MTITDTGLLPEMIFEPDGHLSEVCLTCVADGEIDLVPRAALDHLDRCDACGERLGRAALLSLSAAEALHLPEVTLAPQPVTAPLVEAADLAPPAPISPRRARRPLPIAAIAAALVIAALTAGPALADAVTSLPALVSSALGWLPALWHLARATITSGPGALGPWLLVLKATSAVVFVMLGLSVVHLAARRRAMAIEGGMR